jgi:hypothetical protein
MSNVLVMFQADTEEMEQMALAVGVGAVEAEANIRLRRLAAPGTPELAHKGYGKLKQTDLEWANVVVVGLGSPRPKARELEDLLALLSSLGPGQLAGRQAWTFGPDGVFQDRTEAQIFVESSLQIAGFIVLPSNALHSAEGSDVMEQMKEAGRMLAKLNRSGVGSGGDS